MDVTVITDEAHRSQYDTLAVNMRAALPKALFVAFTGTLLIAGEERTYWIFLDIEACVMLVGSALAEHV